LVLNDSHNQTIVNRLFSKELSIEDFINKNPQELLENERLN